MQKNLFFLTSINNFTTFLGLSRQKTQTNRSKDQTINHN